MTPALLNVRRHTSDNSNWHGCLSECMDCPVKQVYKEVYRDVCLQFLDLVCPSIPTHSAAVPQVPVSNCIHCYSATLQCNGYYQLGSTKYP